MVQEQIHRGVAPSAAAAAAAAGVAAAVEGGPSLAADALGWGALAVAAAVHQENARGSQTAAAAAATAALLGSREVFGVAGWLRLAQGLIDLRKRVFAYVVSYISTWGLGWDSWRETGRLAAHLANGGLGGERDPGVESSRQRSLGVEGERGPYICTLLCRCVGTNNSKCGGGGVPSANRGMGRGSIANSPDICSKLASQRPSYSSSISGDCVFKPYVE